MSLSRDIVRARQQSAMSKPNIAAVRNRPATERRLIHAVEKLLARGGFGVLGPSAVAREAGVDKMLIYRYFGNLDGLVSAVAKSPELFISIEEICAGDIAAMLALPLPERAAAVARNYARALIERPVVLAMMAWETVERNKLTAIVETAREEMSTRIADHVVSRNRRPARNRGSDGADWRRDQLSGHASAQDTDIFGSEYSHRPRMAAADRCDPNHDEIFRRYDRLAITLRGRRSQNRDRRCAAAESSTAASLPPPSLQSDASLELPANQVSAAMLAVSVLKK